MTTCLNCGHADAQTFLFCPRCGTKAPEEGQGTHPLVGRTLNEKYRVVSELGSGAMGTVYVGEHVGLKKKVALKVLHSDLLVSDEQLQRFQREGIAAGKFSHPNAIQIFDFDKAEGGVIYLAMEFVEGSNLRIHLRKRGKLAVAVAIQLTRQVLGCLAEAHRHGIVHRDLKPDNIMVVPASRGEVRVKVLDFGLSKLVDLPGNESSLVTQAGRILGTPLYMAPEQCAGEETDARSDLYAVALILYELVSGMRPFPEENTSELLFSRATKEAPSLLGEFPDMDVPRELDAFLVRGLQRRPEDRFQTAEEMMAALEAIPLDAASWNVSGTSVMTSGAAVQRHRQSVERSAEEHQATTTATAGPGPGPGTPKRLVLGALGLALVAALALWLWPGRSQSERPQLVSQIPPGERTPVESLYVGRLDLARSALVAGNAAGARAALNEALQADCVDAEAFLIQARIFRALRDDDAAIASYDDALARDGRYVEALLGLGWLRLERGELERARSRFDEANELAERSAAALTGLGATALVERDLGAAADFLERALAADPTFAGAHLYRGRLLLEGGDVEGAIGALVEAKRRDPGSWRAPAWLGEAYLAADRFEDAESQWRTALDLADDAGVRADLGTLLLHQGRAGVARLFLQESTRRHPRDGRLMVLYGVALEADGRPDEAIPTLEEGHSLGSGDGESHTLLGLLYHARGDRTRAIREYRLGIEEGGQLPGANLGLGLAQFEQEEYEAAQASLERVLEYDANNLGALFHLGLLHMDYLGGRERALDYFRRYQSSGGDDARINGWLRRLEG